MGSPSIAVPTLDALAKCCDVPLAITQPDRPGGRGRKLHPTAVNLRATELGIPVLATEDVNSEAAISRIAEAAPEAAVVVSFGQILKKRILALPPRGFINVHFSLLPELRGPAPVAWAIIRGLPRTGVTIMEVVRKMDAGDVIARSEEPIRDTDTTADVFERLSVKGADLLVCTLGRYLRGEIEAVPQDESLATYAPKITRELGAVDWRKSAREVDLLIRGLSGQLEAYSFLEAKGRVRVTFFRSAVVHGKSPGPGVAARGAHGELLVGAADGLVEIMEIQAEGRKRATGREFANGYHIAGGEVFAGAQ
jgi:methionyl-tRNA formyltransferase